MSDLERFLLYVAIAIVVGSLLALVRHAARAVRLLEALAKEPK